MQYCLLILICLKISSALLVQRHAHGKIACMATISTASGTSLDSSLELIRRGKVKTVENLRANVTIQGKEHIITKYLEHGQLPFNVAKPMNFYDAIKTPEGMISILPEYNKKVKTGFLIGMPSPAIISGVLRDVRAKGIMVCVDERSGGASALEFEQFAREQSRAASFLPGPIPVVWNDVIIDPLQIEHAAALGASAVVLQASICEHMRRRAVAAELSSGNQPNPLVDFVKRCVSLNVEPVVLIATATEGQQAIAAGARCLCIHSLDEEGILALRDQLPNTTSSAARGPTSTAINATLLMDPWRRRFAKLSIDELREFSPKDKEGGGQKILYIARLRAERAYATYQEVDAAWVLRDHGGFTSVWPSPEAVYATGMREIYSTVTAMRAKACRHFLSPRQFFMDRNEGATEFLGDILY